MNVLLSQNLQLQYFQNWADTEISDLHSLQFIISLFLDSLYLFSVFHPGSYFQPKRAMLIRYSSLVLFTYNQILRNIYSLYIWARVFSDTGLQTDTQQYYLSSTSGFGRDPCSHHLGGAGRLCGNTSRRLMLQLAFHT